MHTSWKKGDGSRAWMGMGAHESQTCEICRVIWQAGVWPRAHAALPFCTLVYSKPTVRSPYVSMEEATEMFPGLNLAITSGCET